MANLYENKELFKWLLKHGNYVNCPNCKKFDAGKSLCRATFYCTECKLLWKFWRNSYSLKWHWYHIPKNYEVTNEVIKTKQPATNNQQPEKEEGNKTSCQ